MKKILLFLTLLAPVPAAAQWTSNTLLNTVVRDSVGFEESVPISATTSDGKTFISYFALYGGSYQLRMQLLDTDGNKMFGNNGLLVSNQPQSTALFVYDMKVNAADEAVVAFQDTRTGGVLNVVAYKVDTLGNLLWGANGIQLIDPLSAEGIGPSVGFTNAGNVIIAWNASNSKRWVAAHKLDPSGNLMWSSNIRVIDSLTNKRYSRATIVPSGSDNFSMLYVEETGFGLGISTMYANRFDNNGDQVWPAPIQVSTKTIPFFFFCRAVSDGNDGFYVSFNTSDSNFPSLGDVYVQHVDGSGQKWNAEGQIACSLANTQRFSASSKRDAASGDFWVLIKTTDVNQNQSGVAVQKFDISGNAGLSPAGSQLMPISASYFDPADFSITSNGAIAFFYEGANSTLLELRAVKCDLNGSLSWLPGVVTVSTGGTGGASMDDLTSGLFINNQVVAVWMDQRNDYGVYAQNITNEGLLGLSTSVSEAEDSNTFEVYPNPFTDRIYVKTIEETAIQITDVSGKVIKIDAQFKAGFYEINTSGFSAGVYFLRAGDAVRKIVKSNHR